MGVRENKTKRVGGPGWADQIPFIVRDIGGTCFGTQLGGVRLVSRTFSGGDSQVLRFLGRPDIVDFWGLGFPGGQDNPLTLLPKLGFVFC